MTELFSFLRIPGFVDIQIWPGTSLQSLRFLLREQTRSHHDALDRQIGALDSVAAYAAYVRGVVAFRARVEPALAGLRDRFVGYSPTLVYDKASTDLQDLGERPLETGEPIGLPKSEAEAFGALYVIEGSTLGARLLYNQAQHLGYNAHWGAQHLHAQTVTGGSWSKLVALLDKASANAQAEAVSSARQIFAVAINSFEAGRA